MYQFTTAQQDSTAKLTVFSEKFEKIFLDLRVNETKLTSRKGFIVNIFELGNKMYKK